jgi:hypothetical protein
MKRSDGTSVGRDPALALQEARDGRDRALQLRPTRRCRIDELVPYEASAVAPVVARRLAELQQGTPVPPPRGVEVDGVILIEDGTNRVVAHCQFGSVEVDVEMKPLEPRDAVKYGKTIALRRSRGTTFATLPVDADDDARSRRTIDELEMLA